MSENKKLRIVFMGTPEFAVNSLDILVRNEYNIVGVITIPDKPAGRGQKVQTSAVKDYSLEKGLKILQPEKLKDPAFLKDLKDLNSDLQIVVAFRMLPEVVWNMPPKGTFNLHGSLLPQYRGAAPINWAIINGESETGVTTFFLQHEIDTGEIILQKKISIDENETAGEVHDKLMALGAEAVLETVQLIESDKAKLTPQENLINTPLKQAPKIFKEDCFINWNNDVASIHNFIRGLSPYPAAWTELRSPTEQEIQLKIFESSIEEKNHQFENGKVLTDGKNYIKVAANNGLINLKQIQLAGKKRMNTSDFLRGFTLTEGWSIVKESQKSV